MGIDNQVYFHRGLFLSLSNHERAPQVGTGLLCLFFHLLCYAAVLKNLTHYAQYYAQE